MGGGDERHKDRQRETHTQRDRESYTETATINRTDTTIAICMKTVNQEG